MISIHPSSAAYDIQYFQFTLRKYKSENSSGDTADSMSKVNKSDI